MFGCCCREFPPAKNLTQRAFTNGRVSGGGVDQLRPRRPRTRTSVQSEGFERQPPPPPRCRLHEPRPRLRRAAALGVESAVRDASVFFGLGLQQAGQGCEGGLGAQQHL
jgi:hypothetical protein